MAEMQTERWDLACHELKLSQLDQLEGDGVNIQCVNSSEFVVGKQTNFNGPVTIINCDSALDVGRSLDSGEGEKEKIVIRNKVLSKSAAETVQQMAGNCEKTEDGPDPVRGKLELWRHWAANRWGKAYLLSAVLFLGLLLTAAITLGILFLGQENPDDEEGPTCTPLARGGGESCIFSDLNWGGGPAEDADAMESPVPYVVVAVSHVDGCFFLESCLQVLREAYGEGKNGSGCNFLVGYDGNVYQDLGWKTKNRVEGPAAGKNVRLCFMGAFPEGDVPTYPQAEAAKALVRYGVDHAHVSANYSLLPSSAISPDDRLFAVYDVIKNWPNFRENLFGDIRVSAFVVDNESPKKFRIFSKAEWGGLPPTSFIEMKLPVPYVIVSHSASPQCFSFAACSSLIKNMQDYHFFLKYADIAYNFLVDSVGNVYEGRGWSRRNVKGGFVNGRSINVNFIGDYSGDVIPTPEQLDVVRFLIDYGVMTGKVSQNYSLIADNSTTATLSPGKNVYARIMYWPHFDPDPLAHVIGYEER